MNSTGEKIDLNDIPGCCVVEKKWTEFYDYLQEENLIGNCMIYRGQSRSEWDLTPGLYRDREREKVLDEIQDEDNPLDEWLRIAKQWEGVESKMLGYFQKNAQGRCGLSFDKEDEIKWWALGQHYGLKTPLLDWTESPFVALFFALDVSEKNSEGETKGSIFVLNRAKTKELHEFLSVNWVDNDPTYLEFMESLISFEEPLMHENCNLISQSGLFTKTLPFFSIELVMLALFNLCGEIGSNIMTKINIALSAQERQECLNYLDAFNINYKSLFLDLTGAAKQSNYEMQKEGLQDDS